jgi:uncharacterized membrane protein
LFKLSYLVRGFPGHPLHPPLTDATIGVYTGATVLGILAFAGVSEESLTKAWWLGLLVGLGSTALTATTTLGGFVALTVGGWLGGTVVYVHGMRVLNLVEEPTERAVAPGHPEKELADGG